MVKSKREIDRDALKIATSDVLRVAAAAAALDEAEAAFIDIAYPRPEGGRLRAVSAADLLNESERFGSEPSYLARLEAAESLGCELEALGDDELQQLDALYWYGEGVHSSFIEALRRTSAGYDGDSAALAESVAGYRDLAVALVRTLSRIMA